MPRVITFLNLKGGVAKTTTTIQVSHNLAKRGRRVLVIDGDPDACCSEALDALAPEGAKTIYDVLVNPAGGIADAVTYCGTADYPVSYTGRLDIIPGSQRISRADTAFDNSVSRQPVLTFEAVPNWVIENFCQSYDYVLIDPSPSHGRKTSAWTYASHGVIAPVSAEAMPKRGVLNMMRILKQSNDERATFRIPGETRLLGLLLSKIIADQQEDAQEFLEKLDEKRIPRFQ